MEAVEVQITEIQPFKVGTEAEWFEFSVQSEGVVDLSEWKITNGKTTKSISSVREKLVIPQNLAILTGSGYSTDSISILPEVATFFTWTKSPVSLKNSGGIVQILDALGTILSEVIYPKGNSGTRKDYKYSEVFNWDNIEKRIYPIIFRNNGNASFSHTKGFGNKYSPSFSSDFKMVISEISPDRDADKGGDFIEFYISQGGEKINLKYLEIKHNGTSLYYFKDDFFVSPGQFLTIWVGKSASGIIKRRSPYEIASSKKEGLSAGSGTVELIVFSDTSYEETIDFVCYQDEILSQTEQKRVDKNTENWKSACIEIKDLISNESMARSNLQLDSDTEGDFFRHFNGTPNGTNIVKNNPPKAVIRVQGSKKTVGNPPFSINLTGEDSTDPDGEKDIASYVWRLNGEIFSSDQNPKLFKVENIGVYTVELTATDHSGSSNVVTQIFEVIPTGGTLSGGSEKGAKEFIENILTSNSKKGKKDQFDNFFTNFIDQAPESFWEELEKPTVVVSSFDEMRIISNISRKGKTRKEKWINKNIGWAFAEDSLEGLD